MKNKVAYLFSFNPRTDHFGMEISDPLPVCQQDNYDVIDAVHRGLGMYQMLSESSDMARYFERLAAHLELENNAEKAKVQQLEKEIRGRKVSIQLREQLMLYANAQVAKGEKQNGEGEA